MGPFITLSRTSFFILFVRLSVLKFVRKSICSQLYLRVLSNYVSPTVLPMKHGMQYLIDKLIEKRRL